MGAYSSTHRGAYLLYLNGIEVPCPAITVTSSIGEPAQAQFALAPHPLLQRLGAEDRIEVAVFYLDDAFEPANPSWRLIFDGEIISWGYTNTPLGTKMQFTAVADLAIFQQMKFYFMTATDIHAYATTAGAGASFVSQPGVFYPFSLFKKGLVYQPTDASLGLDSNEQFIKRPYEILYNAVRGMVDVNIHTKAPATPPSTPLINFFTRWAHKRKFYNRFAALPLFEDTDANRVFPIMESVQEAQALQTISSGLAGAGDQGSMWDVLKKVYHTLLYEMIAMPNAPAFRVMLKDGTINYNGETIKGKSGTILGIDNQDSTADALQPLRLINYFVKPTSYFAIPPACNVIFPSMLRSVEYNEDFLSQPTRTYVNEALIHNFALNNDPLAGTALRVGYPEEVDLAMRAKVEGVTGAGVTNPPDPLSSGRDVLVYPEEFYKGPVVFGANPPEWFTLLMTKDQANKGGTPVKASPQTADPNPIRTLFSTYVRYTHYLERYARRGGNASVVWNPYLVPGFPCVIFDRRQAGLDMVGYLTSVTWSMTTTGMTTSFTYDKGRTLQEHLQRRYEDSVKFSKVLGAGPAEILPPVRDILQDPTQAEQFYRTLFYGRSGVQEIRTGVNASFNKYAAADIDLLVAVDWGNHQTSPIALQQVGSGQGGITSPGLAPPGQIPDFNVELTPQEAAESLFVDPQKAMQYVCRPLCTMEEYIKFKTGDYPGDLPDRTEYVTPFYSRLYRLIQGPASPPPEPAITGYVTQTDQNGVTTANIYTQGRIPTAPDFPQTRINWDEIITAYLSQVRQGPPLE